MRCTERWYATSLITALVLAASACGDNEPEFSDGEAPVPGEPDVEQLGTQPDMARIEFGTVGVQLRGDDNVVEMRVEVAERADQRAFGLMDRDSLPAEGGMIFLYDDLQPPTSGFWMWRTRIPLDIAYFDGAGRIVNIVQMEPCLSTSQMECQMQAQDYVPGAPYAGALEVNRGFFSRHGIGVGDYVIVPGRIGG